MILLRSLNFLIKKNTLILQKTNRSLSQKYNSSIQLFGREYPADEWTNISKSIQDKLNRKLIHQKYHPLNHLANKIKHFFYKTYINRNGNPMFTIFDNFNPVVSLEQNFDRFFS